MDEDLTDKELKKVKAFSALKNLELMGDKFAKDDAEIVRNYIWDLEDQILKLKEG